MADAGSQAEGKIMLAVRMGRLSNFLASKPCGHGSGSKHNLSLLLDVLPKNGIAQA